jgi:hypothetical protein
MVAANHATLLLRFPLMGSMYINQLMCLFPFYQAGEVLYLGEVKKKPK